MQKVKIFKVALATVKGKDTIACLSHKHCIVPMLISKTKKERHDRGSIAFFMIICKFIVLTLLIYDYLSYN